MRILASDATLAAIEAEGVTVERLPQPRVELDGGYSSPDEGDTQLRAAVAASPRAGLVQIGESVEGRPLLAAWFGQAPESGAPDLRVLGAHHGDEWSSFEVALDTALLLSAEDGSRAEVTDLLDRSTVWVAPYINPDGVVYGSRQNANNVDLNRNYDYQWSSQAWMSGDRPFSEPETRAVRAHALTTAPPISLTLHSGAANVGYVWNYSTTSVPDRPAIEALAERYAAACTIEDFWITNGAEWYRTWGDTNDWSYGRYGGMDFTIEATVRKRPNSAEIPDFVAGHREAVLAFLTAPIDLEGRVVDAESGRPIPATVQLAGGGSQPFLTDLDGRFARHAEADADLVIDAPGYLQTRTQAGDIALVREGLSTALPSPGVVSEGTLVELLGAPDGTAVLSQPGHPDHSVQVRDERFSAPRLDGGAWTLTDAAGAVYPRVLLAEDEGPARKTRGSQDGELFTLGGSGLAEGSRVWALVGEERAMVELAVLSEDGGEVVADAAGLAADGDFLTLSNGTWLVHTRRTEGPEPRDTGLPADSGDTGPTGDSGETGLVGDDVDSDTGDTVRPACGCATGTAPASTLVFLLPLLALRRRRT